MEGSKKIDRCSLWPWWQHVFSIFSDARVSLPPPLLSSFVMSRNKLNHFFHAEPEHGWIVWRTSKWASWKVGVIVQLQRFFHAPKFVLRWKSATANDVAHSILKRTKVKTFFSEKKLLGFLWRNIIYSGAYLQFMAPKTLVIIIAQKNWRVFTMSRFSSFASIYLEGKRRSHT